MLYSSVQLYSCTAEEVEVEAGGPLQASWWQPHSRRLPREKVGSRQLSPSSCPLSDNGDQEEDQEKGI